MFDILVYLFESYIHADACPESDQLARKLAAAGFEDEEISEALEWLAGLRRVAREIQPGIAVVSHPGSARIAAAIIIPCQRMLAISATPIDRSVVSYPGTPKQFPFQQRGGSGKGSVGKATGLPVC
mgnify:CR=1 FL=1